MRLIDADRLLSERMKSKYYHLPNGDIAIPLIDIEHAPTVDPQPKTGKWIKLDAHAHLADHKCSACGQECYVPTCMGDPMYDFCPNCGARMLKEGEEHD